MELRPGSRIGAYRVLSVLGKGGMGVVHLAEDARGRRVAVKVVSRQLASGDEFMARFRREARAQAGVSHRNVVGFLEAGEDAGTAFLVFELVQGGTLEERLKARGRYGWREAASLGAGIARGLAAIHAAGMVHRDLKPENVLLASPGGKETPKISDFGLVGAEAANLAVSQALTRTGEIVGTLAFMAPEQADARGVTARSDLYSLGALLHCLLAGEPPFQGTGYGLVKKHLIEKPRPVRDLAPDVPPALERLVLALLEKDPADRPESAEAVALALEEIAAAPPGRSGRGKLAAGIALAVALAVLAGLLAWGRGPSDREEARRLAAAAASSFLEKDYGKTIETASRAIELDRDLALAWALRGESRAERHESDAALADLDAAIGLGLRDAEAFQYLAAIHETRGEHDAAIADATRAIAVDAGRAGAWTIRGAARGTKGDLGPAIQDLTRALVLDPRGAVAHERLIAARLLRGDLDAAIADATRAIGVDARWAFAWQDRGLALEKKGESERALADFTKVIELEPKRALAWLCRGRARAASGDQDGAIADLSRAIELEPGNVAALRARGTARTEKKDLEGALADFESAVLADPRDAAAWVAKGGGHVRLGDQKGAEAAFTKAIELEPGNVRYRINRGSSRAFLGDAEGALADLSKAVELDPRHAVARLQRGIARARFGDSEGALADLVRSVELAPGDAQAPEAIDAIRRTASDILTRRPGDAGATAAQGIARLFRRDIDGGIADLTRAIELDPRCFLALTYRGVARSMRRDMDGALADFARAIELDGQDARPWKQRGIARALRSEWAAALADFDEAARRDDRDAITLQGRGEARLELGELDGALADLDRAIELDPRRHPAWLDRGLARRKKGDTKGAIADVERFLELSPSDPRAEIARAALAEMRERGR